MPGLGGGRTCAGERNVRLSAGEDVVRRFLALGADVNLFGYHGVDPAIWSRTRSRMVRQVYLVMPK